MEYYRLYDLRNQYPSISNYVTTLPGKVNLLGLYSETNVLPIDLKSLEGVKFVKDTSFRFILKIKQKQEDTSGVLYTSERYFKNLEASIKEANPYFINSSLNDIFIIEVFIDAFITLFETQIPNEYSAGIDVLKNNFINKDKSVDYDALVKFIDWVVSQTTLQEIDTNGVILPKLLINFREFEIDQEKAYFYPNQAQSPSASNIINTNTVSPAETQRLNQIKKIQEELIDINSDISLYNTNIALDDYPNGGLSTSKLTLVGKLEEKEYVSKKYLGSRRKQNEDIRKQLTTYLNELKSKKNSLDLELSTLNSQSTTPTNTPPPPAEPTPTGGAYSDADSGGGGRDQNVF